MLLMRRSVITDIKSMEMTNEVLKTQIELTKRCVDLGLPVKLQPEELLRALEDLQACRLLLKHGIHFSTPSELAAAISAVRCYDELSTELIAEEMFKNGGAL